MIATQISQDLGCHSPHADKQTCFRRIVLAKWALLPYCHGMTLGSYLGQAVNSSLTRGGTIGSVSNSTRMRACDPLPHRHCVLSCWISLERIEIQRTKGLTIIEDAFRWLENFLGEEAVG